MEQNGPRASMDMLRYLDIMKIPQTVFSCRGSHGVVSEGPCL